MNNLKLLNYNFCQEEPSFNKSTLAVSFINNFVKSIYNDDIWDFTYQNSTNISLHRKAVLDFSTLNKYPIIKEAIKDLFYKLLSIGMKTTTLMCHYRNIKPFINFIVNDLKIYNLNDINIKHINLYINYIIEKNLSQKTCMGRLHFLESLFFKYRNELKYKIEFHPFGGKKLASIIKKSSSIKPSKQTEIIPDLTWKNIVKLSHNNIILYKKHIEIHNILHNSWIQDYNKNEKSNLNFRKIFNQKKFVLNTKGLNQFKSFAEYKKHTKDVTISCGIIIQAFTGMRISELLSLKRNCYIEDEIILNESKFKIKKINGLTFKYQKHIENAQVGKHADWLCPEIVFEAIEALESINRTAHHIFRDKKIEEYLFTISGVTGRNKLITYNVSEDYKKFIIGNNIEIDFKLTSHCFRRTLARFFARNLLGLPIEVLKEQFKHFSKDITLYYMKEDLKNDGSFVDLINDYTKSNNKLLFEEINNKFNHSILNANNLDEIRVFIGDKTVSLINEYMATLEKENRGISPLKSLTCEGTIILPNIHLNYWKEMETLYQELIELEPNSIWYKNEYQMIKNVIQDLEIGNAHIVKGIL